MSIKNSLAVVFFTFCSGGLFMHYTHFYGKRFNTAFDYIGKMIRNVTNCLHVQLS